VGDEAYHAKLAREKRNRALKEFASRRSTTVGVLALAAVSEAVEACASRENIHFDSSPMTALAKRGEWLNENFPDLAEPFRILLETYEFFKSPKHSLDFSRAPVYLTWWWRFPNPEYANRAEKAIDAMEKIFDVLHKKTGIEF
jgi:hypothetical protein